MLGQIVGHDAVFRGLIEGVEFRLQRRAHEVAIFDLLVRGGGAGKRETLRPFDLDRRKGEKEGPGEISFRADARFGDRFGAGEPRQLFGELRGMHAVFKHVVDCAGDGGAKPVGWKTRDGADAGFTGREFFPVVVFAGAERGDDAHAGDRHDRTSLAVAP